MVLNSYFLCYVLKALICFKIGLKLNNLCKKNFFQRCGLRLHTLKTLPTRLQIFWRHAWVYNWNQVKCFPHSWQKFARSGFHSQKQNLIFAITRWHIVRLYSSDSFNFQFVVKSSIIAIIVISYLFLFCIAILLIYCIYNSVLLPLGKTNFFWDFICSKVIYRKFVTGCQALISMIWSAQQIRVEKSGDGMVAYVKNVQEQVVSLIKLNV